MSQPKGSRRVVISGPPLTTPDQKAGSREVAPGRAPGRRIVLIRGGASVRGRQGR